MTRDVSDVTHQKRGLRFEKSQLVKFWGRRKKVDFRLLAEALRWVRTCWGADGKASIERWYLSPYVKKPFNSKVIKSFVPELRGRKCFSCFGIPMLSLCAIWTLWTFCVPVWICTFHIFMYSYVTQGPIPCRDSVSVFYNPIRLSLGG